MLLNHCRYIRQRFEGLVWGNESKTFAELSAPEVMNVPADRAAKECAGGQIFSLGSRQSPEAMVTKTTNAKIAMAACKLPPKRTIPPLHAAPTAVHLQNRNIAYDRVPQVRLAGRRINLPFPDPSAPLPSARRFQRVETVNLIRCAILECALREVRNLGPDAPPAARRLSRSTRTQSRLSCRRTSWSSRHWMMPGRGRTTRAAKLAS